MPFSEQETEFFRSYLEEADRERQSLLDQLPELGRILDCLEDTIKKGGTIYCCGNGGSACDAMHLVEELVAKYLRNRPGIPAKHFLDAAAITCWSNDFSFDDVFERQTRTYVKKDDVLLVFTTSGNSENILRALKAAGEIGAKTILLGGKSGGRAKDLADISLIVRSNVTSRIQEVHVLLVHIITDRLELRLYPSSQSGHCPSH